MLGTPVYPHPRWIAPIPNLLSALRIAFAIALPFVPAGWRIPLIVCAGASDGLDGYVARRFGATSALGGLLDGIADKIFMLAAAFLLVREHDIPLWQALVVMTRDLTVGGVALYCAHRREWGAFLDMRPRWPGKLTTAAVFPWLVTVLLAPHGAWAFGLFVPVGLLSIVAAVDYLGQLVVAHATRRDGPASSPTS